MATRYLRYLGSSGKGCKLLSNVTPGGPPRSPLPSRNLPSQWQARSQQLLTRQARQDPVVLAPGGSSSLHTSGGSSDLKVLRAWQRLKRGRMPAWTWRRAVSVSADTRNTYKFDEVGATYLRHSSCLTVGHSCCIHPSARHAAEYSCALCIRR